MDENCKYNMESLSFMITDKCNLNCEFCSRNAKSNKNTFMEPKFIKEQIEETLKWAPIKTINISGGEPLLHPKLEEILSIIHSFNLNTRINTNGLLINDKNIELFDKYNVRMFTISLDSADKDIHDKIRGLKGAFETTLQNIEKITQKGYKVFIKATVTPDNIDTILDLMKIAEKVGAYGFSYSRTIPIGRAKDNIETADYEFINKYFEMGRKISQYSLNTKLEFLIDDPLRHKFDVRIQKYIDKGIDISKLRGGCTAGCTFLYVLLDKKVIACPAIPMPCGDLKKNTLKEIWENSEMLKEIRSRKNLKGKCAKCINKNICGGCRAYALATTGDILETDGFCI